MQNRSPDCRKSLIVAFQNVRTLRSQAKQAELSHLMKANGVDIIGLADHKIMHSDSINYKEVNEYLLMTSSAWQKPKCAKWRGWTHAEQ